MLIEFHCTCGHRRPLEPAKLKPSLRCDACKAVLSFLAKDRKIDDAVWLTLGGQTGGPRLAVPVPVGEALHIGRSVSGFLALPGEEIEEAQTELRLEEDGRLLVRHLSGDSGTWINRARIITGVLGPSDKLRVGPYILRRMSHAEVREAATVRLEPEIIVGVDARDDEAEPSDFARSRRRGKKIGPEVIVEEETEDEIALSSEPDADRRWTKGQRIRVALCGVLILAAGLFLARSFLWPALSEEMPRETDFYCPVDGNVVRGTWTAAHGAPICPQCGQRCVGQLKYKEEPLHPLLPEEASEVGRDSATAATASEDAASAPQSPSAAESSVAPADPAKSQDGRQRPRSKRASRKDSGGRS